MENPRPRRPLESLERPESEAEAEAARRGDARRSRRGGGWPLLLGGLLAGALAVAFVGNELRVMYQRHTRPHATTPPIIPIRAPERTRAASLFQEAKNLIRESRWTEARTTLLQLQAEAPDTPGLQDYLALVQKERALKSSGQPSASFQQVNSLRAEAFYQSAQKAKAERRWAQAVEYSRRTLGLAPDHEGAKSLIAELRKQAQQLYQRHLTGYKVSDSNPEDLIPIYREIMDLTLPEDELHQKAQSWLDKLGG